MKNAVFVKPKVERSLSLPPMLRVEDFDLSDIRRTFTQLVKYTVPSGSEPLYYGELLAALGWQHITDQCWRYSIPRREKKKLIFTAHTDTVCYDFVESDLDFSSDKSLVTSNNSILGGDDRAGMALILRLAHVDLFPAEYRLFVEEEMGCSGSLEYVHGKHSKCDLLYGGILVSFDRMGYNDIITHQSGRRGCSDGFAVNLADLLMKQGLVYVPSSAGLYTDGHLFIEHVNQVVNLSVGYFFSHGPYEVQDVDFLVKLGNALPQIDWDTLLSRWGSENWMWEEKEKRAPVRKMKQAMKATFDHESFIDDKDGRIALSDLFSDEEEIELLEGEITPLDKTR